jgi:hypothetical protein
MKQNNKQRDWLYNLLPEMYRYPEAENDTYPLRNLLRLIEDQAEILEKDIEQLWNNFFIETCDRWAIPYIGDLVGNNLLHDPDRIVTKDTARELFEDLKGPDLRSPIALRMRADVAKTIYYRRRKGTLPMLEELARDVTGWAAHAVAFFELLNTTQHLNHVRIGCHDCPDIRSVELLDRLNGPFDSISHTVDVRPISQHEGWYNIDNIGFFLWRLNSYPLDNVPARKADNSSGNSYRYHFNPLGNPAPLFTRQRPEGDEAGLASELHVPGPIRPSALHDDLERCRMNSVNGIDTESEYYGKCKSFLIRKDGERLPAKYIMCKDLSDWSLPTDKLSYKDANDIDRDVVIKAAVDVRLGRIAFPPGMEPKETLDVNFHYGFSADLGGGTYDRSKWPVDINTLINVALKTNGEQPDLYLVKTDNGFPADITTSFVYTSVKDAINDWVENGRRNTVIRILDSRSYDLPRTIKLKNDRWLVIEAANRQRPFLRPTNKFLNIDVDPSPSEIAERSASLTLSGVVVDGYIRVTGDLGKLRLLHSTLIPGRYLDSETGAPESDKPSVIVRSESGGDIINSHLRVEIAFSITGPLRLPDHAEGLWILDSIVDGIGGTSISKTGSKTGTNSQHGPFSTIERSTIFGPSFFIKLNASETIFYDTAIVARRQDGCIRFSYVPEGSDTPRKYRCQPDLEIRTQFEQARKEALASGGVFEAATELARIRQSVLAWLAPSFTRTRYGTPGYAQLSLGCPIQIRLGAEDGSEMGAFCHLKQPQRETNLRIRLKEYLPFGLDAGIIYVT